MLGETQKKLLKITYNLCTKDSVLQYWKVNSFKYNKRGQSQWKNADGFSKL